jgi:hypothetical protein
MGCGAALPGGRDQSSLDTIKIKMVRLNRIINVQRNSINTVQDYQIWAGEKMTGGRALADGAESFVRRRTLSQFSVCRQQRGKIF